MAWECFNALINTSPDFAIQDSILLQHFYMGLDRKTLKYLDTALGGLFFHVSANSRRSILTKILENTPKEVEKKLLEEESPIAKPELWFNPSPTLAILNPKPPEKEETPILDELIDEYGDNLDYHTMRRPQKSRKSSSHEEILDPFEEAFLKKTTKDLVSIISNKWLEES